MLTFSCAQQHHIIVRQIGRAAFETAPPQLHDTETPRLVLARQQLFAQVPPRRVSMALIQYPLLTFVRRYRSWYRHAHPQRWLPLFVKSSAYISDYSTAI